MWFQDIYSVENKQRLTLSNHAHTVLVNDVGVFQPENTLKRGSGELSSNIINHLLRVFRADATSSVSIALGRKRQELNSLFEGMRNQSSRNEAISISLAAYEKQLLDEVTRRLKEKGYSFSIRIDKENLEFLASEEGQAEGSLYGDNVGRYIKAVIEEYCERPYVEREKIYFKELLEDVERAKVSQKLLKFTLYSRNISLNGEKNSILYMKPSCIQEDDERMYNYIVGMIASSQDGPWQIGSVRLTSIKTCTMQSHSGKIISKSEKEIREAIKQRGVQYLSAYSNTGKVVVQLTPEGEKMYRQILHLRPLYIKKEGSIYEFDCTIRQVDNYFFKFGHNAKVLEPQYLADLFMRRYQSAARQYE